MLYDNWFGIPGVGIVTFHAIGQNFIALNTSTKYYVIKIVWCS